MDFADEIALRTTPSPVNLDDNPGVDGLVVRVELYRVRGTNVELLTVKGALEFSLYEGVVGSAARGEVKAFRTWRYAGKELERFLARNRRLGLHRPAGLGQARPGNVIGDAHGTVRATPGPAHGGRARDHQHPRPLTADAGLWKATSWPSSFTKLAPMAETRSPPPSRTIRARVPSVRTCSTCRMG